MDKGKLKFIRTQRIVESLQVHALREMEESVASMIEEATLSDLEKGIKQGFPKTKRRQFATDPIQIPQITITPYTQSNAILFEAVVNNEGRQYNPEIYFEGVQFENEDTEHNVTFTATDGNRYHIQPLQFAKDNARVRCTCLDFFYRFAHTNASGDSLYGNPPPHYQRKTTNRPSVNPMKVKGMCKHLIKLTHELEEDSLLTQHSAKAVTPSASMEPSTAVPPKEPEPDETPPEQQSQEPPPQQKTEFNQLQHQYQNAYQNYEKANDIEDPEQRKNALQRILPGLKNLYKKIQQVGKKYYDWTKRKIVPGKF